MNVHFCHVYFRIVERKNGPNSFQQPGSQACPERTFDQESYSKTASSLSFSLAVMMRKKQLLWTWLCTMLLMLFVQGAAWAQLSEFSNTGREFWVGYGHHEYMEPGGDNSQAMTLYLSNPNATSATVVVRVPGSGGPLGVANEWSRTYVIPANTVIDIETTAATSKTPASNPGIGQIPKGPGADFRLVSPGVALGGQGRYLRRAIQIESNIPINAYSHIYAVTSSGATTLLPANTWGYSYTSINTHQRGYDPNDYSWFFVVARENNTRIRITPSAPTNDANLSPTLPVEVTLSRGEIYQISGASVPNSTGNLRYEMTGSKVVSIKNSAGVCLPFAMFSGSSRTGNECTPPIGPGVPGSSGRDNDMQQMFPENAWGKRFLTAPMINGTSGFSTINNVYKVVVSDPATPVFRNGVALTTLQPGGWYFFTSATADLLTSAKPFTIAQQVGECSGMNPGDPESIVVSPIEQAIPRINFYRNVKWGIDFNAVTIVVPTGALPSLRIDGLTIAGSGGNATSSPHPRDPRYSIVHRRWVAAATTSSITCDSGFTAITYGGGGAESYGYNAGTFIRNLNAVAAVKNELDTSSSKVSGRICAETTTDLIAKINYKPVSLRWDLDTVTGLQMNRAGTNTFQQARDVYTGEIFPFVPPMDSVLEGGVWFYLYKADSANIKHRFTGAGGRNIYLEAKSLNAQGCENIEKIFITYDVQNAPTIDFTIQQAACSVDSSLLIADSVSAPYGNNQRDTIRRFIWAVPNGSPSTGNNDSLKTILALGTYNVRVMAVNQFGCSRDAFKPVTVLPNATADVYVSDTTICEGTEIRVKPTGTGAALGYFWDFGRNLPSGTPDTITTTNQDTIVRRFDTWGTYRIQHRVIQQGNCPPSKAFNLHVFAKPQIGFTYPVGCLPSTGVVQFTDTTKIADSTSKKAAWLWNFGDPNATPSNPNTSTQPNPSHTYQVGTYTINFRVTSDSGCVADSAHTTTFAIAPAFAITPLAPLCENGDSILLNFATVTNNVPAASKVFVGPGVDTTTGYFRPAIAGPGLHELRWIYRTTSGICTDTARTTIRVWAKPFAGFSGPSGGCLAPSGLAEFVGYDSTLADGQTQSYKWQFGDTANVSPTNIDSATTRAASHFYREGGYTIRYSVVTNNGCRADSASKFIFSVSPDISLAALPSVCGSAAPFNLNQYAAINNNVNGVRRWYGTGLDSISGLFNPAAAGAGTQPIVFIYTSNGGCSDTAIQNITVYDLPNRGWTLSPSGGCIGSDGKVTFEGNPYLPTDGQTLTYTWNFGDTAVGNVTPANPNTASTRIAEHIYKEGTYTIKYTVSTSFGCTFDSTLVQTMSIKPDISLGALTAGCLSGDTVRLKNVAAINNNVVGNYRFSGPGVVDSVNGFFVGNVAGPGNHTITLIYTSNGGCSDTATSNIQMYQSPYAGFSFPQGCLLPDGTANFEGKDTTLSDGQTQSFLWNFGDTAVGNVTAANPNTATTRVSSHRYREGSYTINYKVTTNQGCTKDSTVTVSLGVTPDLNFSALPAGCINNDTLRLATYLNNLNNVAGTGRYSGPGVIDSVNGFFVGERAGPGTHNIRYILTSAKGCADTAEAPITMYAAPEVSFTFPTNCLNEVGFAEFFGNVIVPANQTIVGYSWNFGDPNAGPGNPNTANTLNATHNYSQFDTFAIRFAATTNQGCVGDTTVNIPFSLKPNLNQPDQASICESDTLPTLLVVPTVLNNVPGRGYFTGTGVDSLGRFRAHIAGSGLRQVTYVFNSNFGGCADTTLLNIKVFPKPTASLAVTGSLCEDATATLTGQGNVITNTGGDIDQHRWTVEGRTWDTTFLGPLSYQFPTHGSKIIRLRVITDSACVSDEVVDTVRVRDNPVASFTVPTAVCLPNGLATFNSTSTTQDGSVISTGTWDFGDGSNPLTTSTASVTHTYAPARIDSVELSLEVTTQFGCVDDTTFFYKQFFEKPIASFRIEPDTFCQGTPTQILNTSVAPNSQLSAYFWDFGDGSTSRLATPTKAYSFPGDYPVTLAVTSQQGCSSDTTASYNVRVLLQPRVEGGVNKVAAQGSTVQFLATTNDPSNEIRWTPPTGLSSDTVLRPTLLVTNNQLFYVQAVNEGGCVAVDSVLVSVMLPFTIPNAFSPNGDGINDLWAIPGLATYPGATMQVFNRSGAMVFNGQGVTSWDGTRNGSPVPVGTYYYIVDRKNGYPPITGYIVLLR